MNRYLISFTLIFTIHSFSFGQSPVEESEQTIEWKSLATDNVEIKYPADWDIDTSKKMGTSFFLFSRLSDEKDQFKENVNLLIQDLSQYDLSLDQYVEISENQIETMITDGEIIVSERQIDSSDEYHKMIYSGKQGTFDLKFEQYYWLIDKKAYVLTLTCELAQFEAYQGIGEKILSSFEIKNKP